MLQLHMVRHHAPKAHRRVAATQHAISVTYYELPETITQKEMQHACQRLNEHHNLRKKGFGKKNIHEARTQLVALIYNWHGHMCLCVCVCTHVGVLAAICT